MYFFLSLPSLMSAMKFSAIILIRLMLTCRYMHIYVHAHIYTNNQLCVFSITCFLLLTQSVKYSLCYFFCPLEYITVYTYTYIYTYTYCIYIFFITIRESRRDWSSAQSALQVHDFELVVLFLFLSRIFDDKK